MSDIITMLFKGTDMLFCYDKIMIKRKKAIVAKNEIRKAKTIIRHTPIERANNRLRSIKEEALS